MRLSKEVKERLIMKDAPIRAAARDFFKNGSFMVEEMAVNGGRSIVDMALLGTPLHGIEIKSDGDTLNRLRSQVCNYNLLFETIDIVTGYSHLYDLDQHIPNWYGVCVAEYDKSGGVVIERIREGGKNPESRMDALLDLVWKEDLIWIFKQLAPILPKGFRNKAKWRIAKILKQEFCHKMLERMIISRKISRRLGELDKTTEFDHQMALELA